MFITFDLVIDSHTDTCGVHIFYMLNVGYHTGKHDLLLLRKLSHLTLLFARLPKKSSSCRDPENLQGLACSTVCAWNMILSGTNISHVMKAFRPCNLKKTLFSVGLSSLPVRCVAAHTGILHYTRIMIFHSKTYTKHRFTVSFTHCNCSVGVLTFWNAKKTDHVSVFVKPQTQSFGI